VKIYQVGGSVRDALLGLPVKDRDFVVVGATPQAMTDQGFKPVGRDFPVFLHPDTHEEYALARTERKSGRGHQGFTFHASPEVSLEADLMRRDLTINAMARDASGTLIDPHGGQRDLELRVLRHVSPAFVEDPLRVLRVARFAARFGFAVADETLALMRELVERGELADLSPERVWRELSIGLIEHKPSRMLSVLRSCGALFAIAPEIDSLYARATSGAQPDLGVLMARALDRGASDPQLVVQYAIACRHLEPDQAIALAEHLRASIDCRDAAISTARFASTFRRAESLSAADWLALLTGLDALRRPERLTWLGRVVVAYTEAAGEPLTDVGATVALGTEALSVLRAVNYDGLDTGNRVDVPEKVRKRRLDALENWIRRRQIR
jgi:tRNA nucleotidyltransferase (CCA-adding enzyme)